MSAISGEYEVAIATPIGEQGGTASFVAENGAFTGRFESPLGVADIPDGRVEGNCLTWTMEITAPMKLTLDCQAIIDGDTLSGSVKAGLFGAMALSGRRVR
jgi:hypothetical protein